MVRRRISHWALGMNGLLAGAFIALSAQAQTGDPVPARVIFDEARRICDRDRGSLWGRDLCGPMLLVNWRDRSIISNQGDAAGALAPGERGTFTGVLPEDRVLANTPVDWSGVRWTQLLWPFPADEAERHVLIAHELFHRIQHDLGLARSERGNRHLDTLEGRYLLQLEWRALERALIAQDQQARIRAVDDALTFRYARYALFPNAREDEAALQVNEGVPEYTGVRLGLTAPEARRAYAVRNLGAFLSAPTFIRSFAYASGPAYGLLLDDAAPEWKTRVLGGAQIDVILAEATGWRENSSRPASSRFASYDGDGSLRAREEAREAARQERQIRWRAQLVDGPVLTLPLRNANYQFNPQTLQALDGIGTVYPTMTTTDDWGVLIVDGGALLQAERRLLSVSAAEIDPEGMRGTGWRLTLNPGWRLTPAEREGDFIVIGPATR